jgi:hypothetical protein
MLLLSNIAEGSPLRDDLTEILAAGKHASDLTRQLLAFSRRQVAEPREIDVNDVIG